MRVLCCLLCFSIQAFSADGEMKTRVFPVKSELFGGHTFVRPNQPPQVMPMGYREPREPFFAINPAEMTGGPIAPRQSAKAVLLNERISFPAGASALFNPQTSLLAVHNTAENLQHTQFFLEAIDRDLRANLCFMVTVVEAPGEMIRQANAAAASKAGCVQELAHLLNSSKHADSHVSVVGDAFLECRSGQRLTFASMREHIYPSTLTTKAGKGATMDTELMESGLKFEVEANSNAEENEITLNLTLHLNAWPPSQRTIVLSDPQTARPVSIPVTDHWQANFITSLTFESGQTRLIGITKPHGAGDEDVLWAAFLHVGSHRIPSTGATPTSIEQSDKLEGAPVILKQAVFELQDGLLEHFMPVDPPETLQKWLIANGLEIIPHATASYKQGNLTVTNTQENIERIHGILRDMRRSLPATPVFTFQTVEGPAARLRDLVHQHALSGNHAAIWQTLEPALTSGEVSLIDSVRITAESDVRANHQSGRESTYITDFSTHTNGQASVDFEKRTVGSTIELESFVPSNDDLVGISLSHELQTGPPISTRHAFQHAAASQPVDFPLVDFHTAKTTHGIVITPGARRLLSLHRPVGNTKPDVLWATFIHCELHRQISSPQEMRASSATKPEGVQLAETRVFQTPAGFFSTGWEPLSNRMAMEALREAGIHLATADDVQVSNDSRILRVKAPRDQLEAIDAAFGKVRENLSRNVVVTAHIMEVPASVIREIEKTALRQDDHSDLLQRLQTDAKIGRTRHVTTMRIETRGSVRATADQTHQIQQLAGIQSTDGGGEEFIMETNKIGHLFELTPTLAPSGGRITLELALEASVADPVEHREHLIDASGKRLEFPLANFLRSKLTSSVSFRPGSTRLIWIYHPPEAGHDKLHAVFMTCLLSP